MKFDKAIESKEEKGEQYALHKLKFLRAIDNAINSNIKVLDNSNIKVLVCIDLFFLKDK